MSEDKMVTDKDIDELREENYRLNRLMTRLKVSSAHNDVGRYELALHEVGRLQGFEEGVQYAQRITNG